MKPVLSTALALFASCTTFDMEVSAQHRLLQPQADSYMKLGDIKGEFRSEPDSFMKLGDIKGEFRSDASSDESNDAELLWELDHLIWEAEADDFLWSD